MNLIKQAFMVAIAILILLSSIHAENIWNLEAVDSDGYGTHSKAQSGVPLIEANKATFQGIALNASTELLSSMQWQVYVQAEGPDQGGIALYANGFYPDQSTWPRYSSINVEAGDRVEVTGFLANYNGKVNLNERHSSVNMFSVTILQKNAGMPSAQQISDLSTCNYFDQMRSGGGEKYQGQWVELRGVHIDSGSWGNNSSLILADDSGSTLTMKLSSEGDFDSYSAPSGKFNVTGIFDQEDDSLPWHENYRIWVKKFSDIETLTGIENWDNYDYMFKE
jgi:uncharacterized protein DUF5689